MASRYSKVQTSLWTSDKFNAAREFSKIVYLYLLSCPHGNSAGLFRLPEGYATTDLRCSVQRYRSAISDLQDIGLIVVDGSHVRLLEKHAKHQSCVGEDHWNWKGGVTAKTDRIRHSFKYKEWRNRVFKRDDYMCQNCKKRGTQMHAHHIKSFSLHPDLRFETSNGITYCAKCHRIHHAEFGVK